VADPPALTETPAPGGAPDETPEPADPGQHPGAPPPGRLRRALTVAGAVLVGLGVVVLLFVAYQLWGTALVQGQHQRALRAELAHELPRAAAADATRLARPPGRLPATTTVSPAVAPTVAAPAAGQPVGIVRIPAIGVDQVVVEGVGPGDLALGPGHYPGTVLPGELGNAAIAGHRTTHGRPFYDLQALTPGDEIVLLTRQGVFVYDVSGSSVVAPGDTGVLANAGTAQLTLTTCNPRFSAAQRLVVRAALARSVLFPAAARPPGLAPSGPGAPAADDALAGTGGGGVLGVVLLGLVTLAAVAAAVLAARRWRPVVVYAIGVPVVLLLLFAFFTALDPLLPASL